MSEAHTSGASARPPTRGPSKQNSLLFERSDARATRSRNGMKRRLAAREARDLLAREARHREARLEGGRAEVREKNDVGEREEAGMDRGFLRVDVQAGAEKALRGKGRDEGRLVHDRAACRINEDRPLFHSKELSLSESPACRVGEWNVNRQDIHPGKKFLEVFFMLIAVEGHDSHPERLAAPRDGAADAAHAVDSERFPLKRHTEELPRLPPVPRPRADERLAFADPPRHRDRKSVV